MGAQQNFYKKFIQVCLLEGIRNHTINANSWFTDKIRSVFNLSYSLRFIEYSKNIIDGLINSSTSHLVFILGLIVVVLLKKLGVLYCLEEVLKYFSELFAWPCFQAVIRTVGVIDVGMWNWFHKLPLVSKYYPNNGKLNEAFDMAKRNKEGLESVQNTIRLQINPSGKYYCQNIKNLSTELKENSVDKEEMKKQMNDIKAELLELKHIKAELLELKHIKPELIEFKNMKAELIELKKRVSENRHCSNSHAITIPANEDQEQSRQMNHYYFSISFILFWLFREFKALVHRFGQ